MKMGEDRLETLLHVRNDYRRRGTPRLVELHWRDGRKAGINNPQTMQAIMDALMAELDRQIAEAAGKEGIMHNPIVSRLAGWAERDDNQH